METPKRASRQAECTKRLCMLARMDSSPCKTVQGPTVVISNGQLVGALLPNDFHRPVQKSEAAIVCLGRPSGIPWTRLIHGLVSHKREL